MIWNRSPPTTYLQNLVLYVSHESLPAGTAHIMLLVSLPCLCLCGCVGPTWCNWPASNFTRQFQCPRFWQEQNMPAFPMPSSLAENISPQAASHMYLWDKHSRLLKKLSYSSQNVSMSFERCSLFSSPGLTISLSMRHETHYRILVHHRWLWSKSSSGQERNVFYALRT